MDQALFVGMLDRAADGGEELEALRDVEGGEPMSGNGGTERPET